MQANQPSEPAGNHILSPFSDAESYTFNRGKKKNLPLWICLSVVLVVILLITFFLFRYLNDPLRTLEQFPVAKYLEDYKPLAGSKFRGNLRVENDLGWKEGIGRVMVFSFEGNESRAVVVLVPATLAHLYFAKGQTYEGELKPALGLDSEKEPDLLREQLRGVVQAAGNNPVQSPQSFQSSN